MVVLVINGGSSNATMTATLLDIFDDLAHSAKIIQVASSWEARDPWAGRMTFVTATSITHGKTTWDNITSGVDEWYNATRTSYTQGLAANDPRVLGVVDENVLANGIITTSVEAHGVAMFRLRNIGSLGKRDEL